jgi:hypothetical protein
MRERIGPVLASLAAVFVDRPATWARRVERPRRRRISPGLLLWPPVAAASLALGYLLVLGSS